MYIIPQILRQPNSIRIETYIHTRQRRSSGNGCVDGAAITLAKWLPSYASRHASKSYFLE